MDVQLRSIETIRPYPKNARKHGRAIDAVAGSIRQYGWRVPIVVDESGEIICGHARYEAAKKLGIDQVPVHTATGLTAEQVRGLRIADNKVSLLSEWDEDLLAEELAALKALDVDIGSLGFDDSEIAALLERFTPVGATDPDEVPAPPETPVTRPGDLWVLGNHRLLCGDSALPADLDRLLDGSVVHLLNCDPPYNVRVEPRSNNAIAAGVSSYYQPVKQEAMHHQGFDLARHPEKSKATTKRMRPKDRPLQNDFMSDETFAKVLRLWFGNAARVMKPGASFYVWGGYGNLGNYPPALAESGLYFSQGIVWDKQWPVLGRKDFLGSYELAFYGWKEGAGHQFYGPNNIPDLWPVKKVTPTAMQHLTEKPVELASRAIAYSSKPGENVLDLFGGSGSTLIAAEQAGRRAYLMEIDCAYADVIRMRWEAFTGKKAERVPGNTVAEETAPKGAEKDAA